MSRLRLHLAKLSVLGFAAAAASCAGTPTEGGSGGSGSGSGGSATGAAGRSGTGGSGPSATGGSGTGGQIATGGTSGGATGGTSATGTGGGGATGRGGGAGAGTGGAAGATGTGGGVINPTACSTGSAQTADVTVSLSSVQQKITGFGVSSAWSGSYANASDADYLWSTTKGAGLTLLRVRYGDGLAIAQSAAKNGATVWMTPWGTGANGSPGGPDTTTQNNPNGCKTGNMPVLTNLPDFASKLVAWVQNAKTQGVPIYAVSAGNEPDSCGINQTTSYSAAQMAAWIDVLGPAMAGIGVKVMAPETQNACGFTSYYSAIHGDSAAWNAVSIFASHEYGCGTLPSEPAIAAADKEYWETEVDTGTAKGDSSGDGIASALLMGQTIHNDLTKANLNAWHLWWLYEGGNSGGCLYDTGSKVWTKRLWVMGNFSRFVRPGYVRVSTSGTAPAGVSLSAYKNPANGTVAIVAINNNTSATPVSLYISGTVPCSITPWVTSASDNLASQTPITVSNARFSATLAAQSVTTFVGTP